MKPGASSLSLFLYLLLIDLSSRLMAAPELNPDYHALQTFKSSADPCGAALNSWAPGTDPCSGDWVGIFCRGGRVTRILLPEKNLQGVIDDSLTSLPYLRLLNLSHNHLSGELPRNFRHLQRLRRIDFSFNSISGSIPPEIAFLPSLVTLRLEENRLSGSIPSSLESFSKIHDLNLSGNSFSGEIPAPLSAFPVSSFSDDEKLRGERRLTQKRHVKATIAVVVTSIVVCILLFFAWMIIFLKKRINPISAGDIDLENGENNPDGVADKREFVFFRECEPFSIDDLLGGWAQLLGKGSVGRVYKVIMEDYPGRGIAVRHIRGVKTSAVENLLSIIGGLRHPNVVPLLGYYLFGGDLFLAYDYLPKRSLHTLLHDNRGSTRTPLSWKTRLDLALGAAKGLAFLHGASPFKPSHGNIASQNILVDYEGEARVADFGLHYLVESSAHERDKNAAAGQERDVYAFGVILMEILSGRPAAEGVELARRKSWSSDFLDVEIKGKKMKEEEMLGVFQVASLCLNPSPCERPSMKNVWRMIWEIRKRGSRRSSVSGPSSPLSCS